MAVDSMVRVRGSAFWLKRLARYSSWALLAGVVVLVLSGWGITQTGVIYDITFGLVDRRLADSIHRATVFPLFFFFLLHVFLNFSLMVANKRPFIKNAVNGILIILGAFFLWVVVYMEYFRLGG
jgi:hypothetical protein